jgi:peroxiredoxin
MKKLTLSLLAVAVIGIAAAAYASTKKVVVFAGPGVRTLETADVFTPTYIEVIGALPADGTVTLSRVVGGVTNTFATAACSGGSHTGAVAGAYTLLRGDTLLVGGTVTSGVARVVGDAD